MESPRCNLYTDCKECSSNGKNIFYQLKLIKGYSFQQYRHKENEILFILSGRILIKGLNVAGMTVSGGQLLSIPRSIEIDMVILEDVDCLVYVYREGSVQCKEQYRLMVEYVPETVSWNTLDILPPLQTFVDSIVMNLENSISCNLLWSTKEQEFMLLMNRYFPKHELLAFFAPMLQGVNRFRIFVQHNYYKVKSVEELALLGGYGLVTFRRLFKEEYGEPAHRWMSRQKQEHILYDLKHRDLTISEVSYKYQFESLSHFSNFCKKYFGKAPRDIVKDKVLLLNSIK